MKKSIKDDKNKFTSKDIVLLILGLLLLVVLIVSIIVKNGPRSGKLICTYNNITSTMKSSFDYEVDFKNKKVTNLKSVEKVVSDDAEMLKDYKDSLEVIYEKYKDLKYYNNEIVLDKNTLTTTTIINYKKIDMNEYRKIDSSNSLLKKNKIHIKKIRNLYLQNGAKCRYK